MKLITKSILKKATSQYKLGSDMKQKIVAKFFDPYGSWSWYLMNIDPDDEDYCWGIVDGFAVEMGSFSIKELEADKAPFGSPRIERDKYWAPKKASEVWSQLNERGSK